MRTPQTSGKRLDRLLRPRSLAFIGGDPAETSIRQCEALGFSGETWLVHPTRDAADGRVVYRSIEDLPFAPDAALVAVNRESTVGVVRELAIAGAGAAICYASGFAEVDEVGADLEAELLTAAAGMPIIGPNCYGTLSGVTGAALWPDQQGLHRVDRGIAFVTQSGNIAVNLTMQTRGLSVAHVLTLGNQIDVGLGECLEALVDDASTTAVAMHMEALHDVPRFAAAMTRAHQRNVPVVVLKTGASDRGAAIAASHTSSMVGDDVAYDALFERLGVRRVHSVPELLDTTKVLASLGALTGARITSLSCSGGEASLVADLAMEYDVEFADFKPEHAERIKATLNDIVAVSNPMDYHTFIWGDRARLEACFHAVLDGPLDAAILVVDFPRPGLDGSSWLPALEAFGAASHKTGIPGLISSSMAENMPDDIQSLAESMGLVALGDIEQALRGLEAAAWLGAHSVAGPVLAPERPYPELLEVDYEVIAKEALESAGIAAGDGRLVKCADRGTGLSDLRYPLAVKAVGMAHKSDVGGVILEVSDSEELAVALAGLAPLSEWALVEHYIDDAVAELLIDVRRASPAGYLLTIGSGGTLVEVLGDTQSCLLPVDDVDLMSMLRRLTVWPLLDGHRGADAGDVEAVAEIVQKLTAMVRDRPDLVEVELNPVLVRPAGAVVVDALITREMADE